MCVKIGQDWNAGRFRETAENYRICEGVREWIIWQKIVYVIS